MPGRKIRKKKPNGVGRKLCKRGVNNHEAELPSKANETGKPRRATVVRKNKEKSIVKIIRENKIPTAKKLSLSGRDKRARQKKKRR